MIDYINKKLGKDSVSIGIAPKTNKIEDIIAFGHIPKTGES